MPQRRVYPLPEPVVKHLAAHQGVTEELNEELQEDTKESRQSCDHLGGKEEAKPEIHGKPRNKTRHSVLK